MESVVLKHRMLAALQRDAKTILRKLKFPKANVEIELLSNREMQTLEKTYLHKNKKDVNVLSFPAQSSFPHPETAGWYLGEVYLNWDMFNKNSDELRKLLIHGILHLLGYDHDERRATIETRRMEKLEAELWHHTQS